MSEETNNHITSEMEIGYVTEFLLDAIACNTTDDEVDSNSLILFLRHRVGSEIIDSIQDVDAILLDIAKSKDGTSERKMAVQTLAENIQRQRMKVYTNYDEFEERLRVNMNESNGFTPLTPTNTYAYRIDDDGLFLHLNPSYAVQNKRRDLRLACSKLATELQSGNIRGVDTINAYSHLVAFRPKLFKLLGFKVDSHNTAHASISVEDFITRWSSNADAV